MVGGRKGVSETGSKSYATWQLNKSQKVDEPKSHHIKSPIERGKRKGSTVRYERGFETGLGWGKGATRGVAEECEYVCRGGKTA